MKKKNILILLLCVTMLVSACTESHSQKNENTTINKPAPASEAVQKAPDIFGDISSFFDDDKDVYIYFYAGSYPHSNKQLPRITKLADAEKAGMVAVDVEDDGLGPVVQVFSIYYVPSVVHLRKGQGVIENFHGRRNVEQMDKDHKPDPPKELIEQIEKNTAEGKTTVLEFFADWCNPCMEQMPALENAEKLSGGRLSVIRLHVDQETEMARLYNIEAPPANIIIDKNGIPRAQIKQVGSPAYLLDMLESIGLL